MSRGTRIFDETKCISFLIEDEKLLKRYNKIWNKVSYGIKKEFGSKFVVSETYWRTKVKPYKRKINTVFHNDKMSKQGSHCIFLSMILINSFLKTGKNYKPQVL